MAKTEAEVRAELADVELQLAKNRLEESKEHLQEFTARREQKARQNAQRQAQMKTDRDDRAATIARCSHRQGGSPGAELEGEGASCLKGIVMPQEERRVVMCNQCPLRVWEPRKIDGSAKQRKGESATQAADRVKTYRAQLKDFESLWKDSQRQLTREAGRPMHCGKTFTFSDSDGNAAHVPHPCDSYAQGLDNRTAA